MVKKKKSSRSHYSLTIGSTLSVSDSSGMFKCISLSSNIMNEGIVLQ